MRLAFVRSPQLKIFDSRVHVHPYRRTNRLINALGGQEPRNFTGILGIRATDPVSPQLIDEIKDLYVTGIKMDHVDPISQCGEDLVMAFESQIADVDDSATKLHDS